MISKGERYKMMRVMSSGGRESQEIDSEAWSVLTVTSAVRYTGVVLWEEYLCPLMSARGNESSGSSLSPCGHRRFIAKHSPIWWRSTFRDARDVSESFRERSVTGDRVRQSNSAEFQPSQHKNASLTRVVRWHHKLCYSDKLWISIWGMRQSFSYALYEDDRTGDMRRRLRYESVDISILEPWR